jgi:hypothetical protein
MMESSPAATFVMSQSQFLLELFVISLSGEGLARCQGFPSVRFQSLPIRTARAVFPQAAHPVGFVERVMCRVGWQRLSRHSLRPR